MKRTGIRRGTKGLKRGKGLDARSELKRRTDAVRQFVQRGRESSARSLDVSRRRKPRPTEGPLSPKEWWLDAWSASGGWCIISRTRADGPEDPRYEAHHVLPKGLLRARGLYAYVWDPRNSIWLATLVHGRHTSGFRRVPRLCVPPSAWAFAQELDELSGTQWATERIRRDYPMKEE